MLGLAERDIIPSDLISRLEAAERRIRYLEDTHPGVPGEAAGKLAYYRPDNGGQYVPRDVYIGNQPSAWRVLAAFVTIPGVIAVWPFSVKRRDSGTDQARDVTGAGYHLTAHNTPIFAYDNLAPYAQLDGVSKYFSRADGGAANWADVRGGEGSIVSWAQGLTLGGYFYFDNDPGANAEMMIGKSGANCAYRILRRSSASGGQIVFQVDGGAGVVTVQTSSSIAGGAWHFCMGRFKPSTSVEIFDNGTWAINTTSIPALIQDVADDFTVGASATPVWYMDGRVSFCFLSQMYLSATITSALWDHSYPLFGL